MTRPVLPLAEHIRAVLLGSPDNPTGPALREMEARTLLAQVPREVLVVLDEAWWY